MIDGEEKEEGETRSRRRKGRLEEKEEEEEEKKKKKIETIRKEDKRCNAKARLELRPGPCRSLAYHIKSCTQ